MIFTLRCFCFFIREISTLSGMETVASPGFSMALLRLHDETLCCSMVSYRAMHFQPTSETGPLAANQLAANIKVRDSWLSVCSRPVVVYPQNPHLHCSIQQDLNIFYKKSVLACSLQYVVKKKQQTFSKWTCFLSSSSSGLTP